MSELNIQVACDNDIHPPRFGGAQRTFGLARGLARRHRVRVLCVVPNRGRGAREEVIDGVTLRRRKAWHTSVAWRLERAGLAPLWSAAYGHGLRVADYRRAMGEGADVLAVDLNLAALLTGRGVPLGVYSSQNVEYDRFRGSDRPPRAARWWAERLRGLEAAAVARAERTIVCSDEDAARMRELYGVEPGRLVVIPNGFDEREVRAPAPGERAAARAALGVSEADYVVAFVGADWGPNRAALGTLCDRVLPALAGERVKLLVVGTVTRALEGRREPWLIARGEVADLLPLLHAADAGVNPVEAGGGSNVKVPTCLAAGLAMVTTPFGLRGYAPLSPLCVVAGIEAFADALRARPRGFAALGEAPPAVLGEFTWLRLGARLGEALEAAVDERAGALPAPLERSAGAA